MDLLDKCKYLFEFGDCSVQTLPSLESGDQNTLHGSQVSIIHFTTTVNHIFCDVSFRFQPFRRRCNLTYHEYEIICLIPHGTPDEGLCKRSIIHIAQRLYETHFSKNAGYKIELLETELQICSPPQGVKRKASPVRDETVHNQASSIQDHVSISDHQPAPNVDYIFVPEEYEEPLPKGPHKHTDRKQPMVWSFMAWEPVSIEDVRESYKRAKLQFPSLPQLGKTFGQESWDPFVLRQWLLRHALLDKGKLNILRKQLKLAKQKVPNKTQWTERTEELRLAPMDLRSLLQTAFTSPTDAPNLLDSSDKLIQASASGVEMPPILGVAVAIIRMGINFDGLQTTYRRAMLITRIIGYALMRVSEVAGEVIHPQIIKIMKASSGGNDNWQQQSRNLACFWCWAMAKLPSLKGRELAVYLMLVEDSGEKILRDLFQPALPAAAGEFVSLLSSEEYSQDLGSANVPGVVEIVKVLLQGYVSDVTICRALGCPDSYLDGESSATNLLTRCSFLVRDGSSVRRTKESTAFLDMDADPGETFSYIYSGGYEGIETLLSQGYDFPTLAKS